MKKLRVFESLKYLHVCISANENEENENWEGRIRYMDTKMDKNSKKLADELVQDKSSIQVDLQAIKKSVEGKIFFFENKILLTEEKIETKVSSIDYIK